MAEDDDSPEHWSLYLIDTYILLKVTYILFIVVLSSTSFSGLTEWGQYMWYKLIGPVFDVDVWRNFNEWASERSAKAPDVTPAATTGGGSRYNINKWMIVLASIVFIIVMAVLFPKQTYESFSMTMPAMFEDILGNKGETVSGGQFDMIKGSVLDTEKTDEERLQFLAGGFLFSELGDKYTVDANALADINFIRDTDAKAQESAISLDNFYTNILTSLGKSKFGKLYSSGGKSCKFWKQPGAQICGEKNDTMKDLKSFKECATPLRMGSKCHNGYTTPCCQRYCPADNRNKYCKTPAQYYTDPEAPPIDGINKTGIPIESEQLPADWKSDPHRPQNALADHSDWMCKSYQETCPETAHQVYNIIKSDPIHGGKGRNPTLDTVDR